jgi:hypothetical protein
MAMTSNHGCVNMDMHIKTYAITRRALEQLLNQSTGTSVEIPGHWFNWSINSACADALDSTALTRFTVVEQGSYDEYRQRWVEASNQQGLLPVFIFSLEDGPVFSEWPETDPIDLMLPIKTGVGANSDLENLLGMRTKEEAIVAVLPLPVDDPEMCLALATSLSLPEAAILSAWEEFCDTPANVLDDFCDIDVPSNVWTAVADGLQKWVSRSAVANQLAELGYPRLHEIKPLADLSWREFAFEPSIHHIQHLADKDLYIPCRSAPFCGVGIRDRVPRPFGFLRAETANGSWAFGDSLRLALLALQTQATSANETQTADNQDIDRKDLVRGELRGEADVEQEMTVDEVRAWLSQHFGLRAPRRVWISERFPSLGFASGEPLREHVAEFDESDSVRIKITDSTTTRWLAILKRADEHFELVGEWSFEQAPECYSATIPSGSLIFLVSTGRLIGE